MAAAARIPPKSRLRRLTAGASRELRVERAMSRSLKRRWPLLSILLCVGITARPGMVHSSVPPGSSGSIGQPGAVRGDAAARRFNAAPPVTSGTPRGSGPIGGRAPEPERDLPAPKGGTDSGLGAGPFKAGGPDRFGYTYIDSDSPGGPAFSWVDVRTVGTSLPVIGDDVTVGPFPIGFAFPFYGNTFTSFNASTNGCLSFTSMSIPFGNVLLPSTSAPPNLLAVFWDDLVANGGYFYNDGSRLIIQYKPLVNFGGASSYEFEVLLYPNGDIIYQYLNMSGVLDSATIGIQDGTGTDGLTASVNVSYAHSGLAIRFAVQGFASIQVTPDSLAMSLVSGDATTSTLNIHNAGARDLTFDVGIAAASLPALQPSTIPESIRVSVGVPPQRAARSELDQAPLALAVQRAPTVASRPVLVIADGGTEGDVNAVLAGAGYSVTQVVASSTQVFAADSIGNAARQGRQKAHPRAKQCGRDRLPKIYAQSWAEEPY